MSRIEALPLQGFADGLIASFKAWTNSAPICGLSATSNVAPWPPTCSDAKAAERGRNRVKRVP
ncbi:hypothetical protein [Pseudomonas sp. Fl5BN2]|uniref:hypothetical protein n=1 Tax=Pseudomonas sp. Fl5BN2 TaxID=2697652 RepID=UPI002114AAE5|nr:hypothetical protein [Pseudomonas sp. Fl5BN2]